MSRRALAVLFLALANLSLAACSDVTAPTSQNQITPTASSANACLGGSLLGTGRAC